MYGSCLIMSEECMVLEVCGGEESCGVGRKGCGCVRSGAVMLCTCDQSRGNDCVTDCLR